MIYTIGICDDKKSTCSELENMIIDLFKQMNNYVDVQVWNCAESFMKDVPSKSKLDILFLDVEFPKYKDISVGDYIREICNNQAMHIIYTSSNRNYKIEWFRTHPYEFLVKPIDKEKLYNTIKKLLQLNEQDKRFFVYNFNKKQYKILMTDILYFKSEKKNVNIVFSNNSVHYIGKLKEEINRLPDNFVMIGQSYIVNLNNIKVVSLDSVIMNNNDILKISRSYKKRVDSKIREYNKVKRIP